jgi:site-specific recombinase XerD
MSESLPSFARSFLKQNNGQATRHLVAQFHHWMSEHTLSCKTLLPGHIDTFLKSGISVHQQAILQRYLVELRLEGHIYFHPVEIANTDPLPAYAIKYLDTRTSWGTHQMVKRFHRWLSLQCLELVSLQSYHIETFLAQSRKKTISVLTRKVNRRELHKYLSYLDKKKHFILPPEFTVPAKQRPLRAKRPLPQPLEKFIGELSLSRKPATINGYRVSLRAFHSYLDRQHCNIAEIGREEVFGWFKSLNEGHLHPSTRYSHVTTLRVYLDWLYLQGLLLQHPGKLVYKSDFPKLPDYLPRPLARDIDQGLQTYLAKKKHIAAKGLLLMRKTGIRIGELRSLDYDCVRCDLHGNMLLKVPLGKLNNERLVPLLPDMARLIEKIKLQSPTPRLYLIATTKSEKLELVWFTKYLNQASKKLGATPHIVSHQLRHSCATELLNGGMALTTLMKFLGHRDIRMTLRYAKVTQESIIREFQAASASMETRYKVKAETPLTIELLPDELVSQIIKWLHKHRSNASKTAPITQKLYKLRAQLLSIQAQAGG